MKVINNIIKIIKSINYGIKLEAGPVASYPDIVRAGPTSGGYPDIIKLGPSAGTYPDIIKLGPSAGTYPDIAL